MNIIKTDIYDVKSYTDMELYNFLDLINPSDRELEAKIIFYIRKYQEIKSNDSVKLETFFQDIYSRFFITEEFETTSISEPESEKNIIEGFDVNISDIKLNKKPVDNTLPIITNNPNQSNPSIIKDTTNSKEINYTNTLTYAPNNLNPLLKQTIKRMVVIDSQFREWQKSYSTNFTVNFSEVLKDVVSLSLTSFQIPYTWYTINKDYGSNFFYIKGNSPGIDNGNHDYQIAIPPGNYTSTTLNDTINTSINNLKQTYSDVCFNNTDICYNTFSCNSTINVGITDMYDYSNYRFKFGTWKTPIQDNATLRSDNIASFLGFNYQEYSTNSFYSSRTISQNTLSSGTNNYIIDTSNNTIKVIQYWDDSSFDITDYQANSNEMLKYNTLLITLDTGKKLSVSDILNDINNKMHSSEYFDPLSDLSLVLINDPSLNNSGSAFFKWTIKLNRKTTVNKQNARTVVLLPDVLNDSIWVGPSTLFSFNSTTNELNNMVSETPVINQSNDFSGVIMKLKSTLPGYDLSKNDITYQIADGSKLSLNQFFDKTNTNLFEYVGTTNSSYNYKYIDISNSKDEFTNTDVSLNKRKTDLTGSNVFLNSNSKIEFTIDIIRTFYGSEFDYDITGTVFKNNNLTGSSLIQPAIDLSSTIIIENGDVLFVKQYKGIVTYSDSYRFESNYKKLISISSKTTSEYVKDISFNLFIEQSGCYGGVQGLADLINGKFKSFTDYSGSFPLNRSSIVFTQRKSDFTKYDYVIQIIVKKIITETDYNLVLYDLSATQLEDSIWYQYYNMQSDEIIYKTDISYNIKDFSNSIIVSPTTVNTTTIFDLSATTLDFYCITPGYNVSGNHFQISVSNDNITLPVFCDTLNDIFNEYRPISFINYIDISQTRLQIQDTSLNFTFQITNHLNDINNFTFTIGTFFNSIGEIFDHSDTISIEESSLTPDLSTKIYTGRLINANNYSFMEEKIGLLDLSSNNPNVINDISYSILMNDVSYNNYVNTNSNQYYGNDLLDSIIRSITIFSDDTENSSYPFSQSTLTRNGKYDVSGFRFLFDYEDNNRWKKDPLNNSQITQMVDDIKFNVSYDGNGDSSPIIGSIQIDTSMSLITDISLSFDVSYNTFFEQVEPDEPDEQIHNRQLYIMNEPYIMNESNGNSIITVTDLNSNLIRAHERQVKIPLVETDTSGSYHVHMYINSGDIIKFDLSLNDNTISGSSEIYINNFRYSFIDVPIYYDWSMNIHLDKKITEKEYSVKLSDIHNADNTKSIWCNYFDYSYYTNLISKTKRGANATSENITYTLSKYTDLFNNNSYVISKNPVELDRIDLTSGGLETTFYIKPYIGAEGVYDYSYRNDLSFSIPANVYTSTENLINAINQSFNANPITKGTIVSVLPTRFCQIRWNINKVFTTNDYKLVFYDTTSFVKCFIGNSSYRNSSPDTTLGWILGFHSLTEYILKDGDYISSGYYVNQDTREMTGNSYNITYVNDVSGAIQKISIIGDTTVTVDLYKYLMIIIDDYTQNHLNDGLVTIAQKDTSLVLPSYASRSKYQCDPITGNIVNTGITSGSQNNLTQNQIYSINQIINAQNTKLSLISAGPFVKDVFAMIPLDIAGMQPGQIFTDKVTAVQDRVYFGPVNIHKLAVKLINDKGDVLDLNGSNWSLQLMCEQLYQATPSNNNIKIDSSNLL